MQSPQGHTPPPPPRPAQKKGLGPVVRSLIGCSVIVVLVFIGFATVGYLVKSSVAEFEKNPAMTALKLAVAVNPDLETVSTDEGKKTVTIRNKKTNMAITLVVARYDHLHFSYDNGFNVKATADKGKQSPMSFGAGTLEDLPSWVPKYPGATPQRLFACTTRELRAGGFTITTTDAPGKVLAWYEAQVSAGFGAEKPPRPIRRTISGGRLNATSGDQKREVDIFVSASGTAPGSQAVVSYKEKS
ncbi:MAG TPA: hypothetical protein VHR45_17160 [Thermoanaerobaculia bacterium]|nr:hypothetical protein [Thermoanaerobaculia bacterium]